MGNPGQKAASADLRYFLPPRSRSGSHLSQPRRIGLDLVEVSPANRGSPYPGDARPTLRVDSGVLGPCEPPDRARLFAIWLRVRVGTTVQCRLGIGRHGSASSSIRHSSSCRIRPREAHHLRRQSAKQVHMPISTASGSIRSFVGVHTLRSATSGSPNATISATRTRIATPSSSFIKRRGNSNGSTRSGRAVRRTPPQPHLPRTLQLAESADIPAQSSSSSSSPTLAAERL